MIDLGSSAAVSAPQLLGRSSAFLAMQRRLPAVARAQRTTLISGPTGSGKDVVAHALHDQSVRRSEPFVTVHCAALPETLVEAEMFGHCRGAFTGATQARGGLIRSVSQGTLFLDEIDSLPPASQAKLLRFLETGEYRAIGADHSERSDAWVIAATNANLETCVSEGSFRSDLLYRLSVVRVDVPPLARRDSDVLYLAEHFLDRMCGGSKCFSEAARRVLAQHDWPGNVRELKHRVESAGLLSEGDCSVIGPEALGLGGMAGFTGLSSIGRAPTRPEPAGSAGDPLPLERELWSLIENEGLTLSKAVGLCEQLLVHAALRAEGNNRTRAAGRLGIHVRTIFKKLTD